MSVRKVLPVQLPEIVDFSIEGNPYGFIFIRKWLMAAFDIDDGQPAEAKPDPVATIKPFIIRPTMVQVVSHRFQRGTLDDSLSGSFKDTANATHKID